MKSPLRFLMETTMPPILKLTIELSEDGQTTYESYLKVPLPSTEEEVSTTVSRWLELMRTGLSINASEISAKIEKKQDEAV